jgi:hypothetical protein
VDVIVAVSMVVAVIVAAGVASAGVQLLKSNAATMAMEKIVMLLVALVFFMDESLSSKVLRDGFRVVPQ